MIRRCLVALWLLLASMPAAYACTAAGCVLAGPRLASVNTERGALINAVFGSLLQSSLSVNFVDWNAVAQGDVSLIRTLNALQAQLGVADTATALDTPVSVAQIITAMATASIAENNFALGGSVGSIATQLNGVVGNIKLGDLLQITGAPGNSRINVLDVITGSVQLFNRRNVLTTPAAITVSGASLGLGSILGSVKLYAQVIEPPIYVCGPVNSQFHTAAIRVKLDLTLVTLNPPVVSLLGGTILGASLSVGHLDLYLEVARAEGTIDSLNAISGALTVKATPGLVDLYLGRISDANFYNRGRAINPATDLTPATVGALSLNVFLIGTLNVDVQLKSWAKGQAPTQDTLVFTGPYPQKQTASTGTGFVGNLLTQLLVTNFEVSATPAILGLLTNGILTALKPVLTLALNPILTTLTTGLIDPLLELLGVRLGEVDVIAGGAYGLCTVSGTVYDDANHSARLESGEAGTGATLYAKLILASSPSAVATVATVNPSTGVYSFTNVTADTYTLIVDTNTTIADVTAGPPSGWIATEIPTLSRSVPLTTSHATGLTFGLYHGSRIDGRVFQDTGVGVGIANNGIRDGTEPGLAGSPVNLTDSTGATVISTTVSAEGGTYTLWAPFSTQGASLKIVETNPSPFVSVAGSAGNTGGAYVVATDTVTFTHASGSSYSNVLFADVPSNRFEPDGVLVALPGTVVFHPHTFTSGSAGLVTITGAATPTQGWSNVVYRDLNCNGQLDIADTLLVSAVSATAGSIVCVVVKVTTPESAAPGAGYSVGVTASFAYANNALVLAQIRTDLTTTGSQADGALRLAKTVDRATARSGDVLVYTIVYSNAGSTPLTTLRIRDTTPAWTLHASAACGSVPTGLSGCAISAQPSVGGTGTVVWQFNGALAPAATGSVTFSVVVQ